VTLTPSQVREIKTAKGSDVVLGPIKDIEHDDLFALFTYIVATLDGFPQSPPLTYEAFESYWVKPVSIVVAARIDGHLVGAYYLKPNFLGRAAHIANAGYVVAPDARGLGVGRALVEDSILRAPLVGFDAVQFNLVFESNPARKLYEELGWLQIGRIPQAVEGEDAIIYWRSVKQPQD
jgi:GNAT superfamily N-acetyltransferase